MELAGLRLCGCEPGTTWSLAILGISATSARRIAKVGPADAGEGGEAEWGEPVRIPAYSYGRVRVEAVLEGLQSRTVALGTLHLGHPGLVDGAAFSLPLKTRPPLAGLTLAAVVHTSPDERYASRAAERELHPARNAVRVVRECGLVVVLETACGCALQDVPTATTGCGAWEARTGTPRLSLSCALVDGDDKVAEHCSLGCTGGQHLEHSGPEGFVICQGVTRQCVRVDRAGFAHSRLVVGVLPAGDAAPCEASVILVDPGKARAAVLCSRAVDGLGAVVLSVTPEKGQLVATALNTPCAGPLLATLAPGTTEIYPGVRVPVTRLVYEGALELFGFDAHFRPVYDRQGARLEIDTHLIPAAARYVCVVTTGPTTLACDGAACPCPQSHGRMLLDVLCMRAGWALCRVAARLTRGVLPHLRLAAALAAL